MNGHARSLKFGSARALLAAAALQVLLPSVAGRAQAQINAPDAPARISSSPSRPDPLSILRSFAPRSAPETAAERRERELGIRRLDLGGNLGIGAGAQLQFTTSDVTAGGSGITRQGLTLTGGGLLLRASYLRVDESFSRFADLADGDRGTLQKLRGGEQLDLSGQWAMAAVKVEGSLLRLRQAGDAGQNNARLALSLTPGGRSSLGALHETTEKNENGAEQRRSLTRFTGATLLGSEAHGLALRGSYETQAERQISGGGSAARSGTTTTTLGLRTAGTGALRLSLEGRNVLARRPGAPERRNGTLLSEIGLRLGRAALASCTLGSDTTTEGETRTENNKQCWGLEFGRGFLLRRSEDDTWTQDRQGRRPVRRITFTQFATDPAGSLFASGERRACIEGDDTAEVSRKWKGGLTLGGLSLRADGLSIRWAGARPSERNDNLAGKLLLPGGWSATYDRYDRVGKDPRTGLDRDEAGQSLIVGGVVGALRIALTDLSYDDRRPEARGGDRREICLASARPGRFGPLRQGSFTLTFGARTPQGGSGGRTCRISFDGLLGAHRLAFEHDGGSRLSGSGFRFTSNERRCLRVDLMYGVKPDARDGRSIRTRSCGLDWKIGANRTLSYSRLVNPVRTDGVIERRRAETIRYLADLGRGGKLAADYSLCAEPEKNARTRIASFSLVTPASETSGCELSCAREQSRSGNCRGETRTYQLAFHLQPAGGALEAALAARWVDHSGDLHGVGDACDEAQASGEIKVRW